MNEAQSDQFFDNPPQSINNDLLKEMQDYEDEHGMDNWGAFIPDCPISEQAMEIIKNLK